LSFVVDVDDAELDGGVGGIFLRQNLQDFSKLSQFLFNSSCNLIDCIVLAKNNTS